MKLIDFHICLVSSFLVTGCALLRTTDPYAPVTVRDVNVLRDSVDSGVENVTDSAVTETLSLDYCITSTLENNPDLRASIAEIQASEARLCQVRSAMFPSLRIESGYEYYSDPQRILPPHGAGETGVFADHFGRTEAVISVPLFNGGRLFNGTRAEAHISEMQKWQTQGLRDELVFTAARLYHTIQGLEKRAKSVVQSLEAMESQRSRIVAMLDAKKAARVDLLRTDVRAADLKRQMLVVRNQQKVLIAQLGSLMDTDIENCKFVSVTEADTSILSVDKDILYEQALYKRGDYRASREQLELQAKRVDIARGLLFPAISGKLSYGIKSDFRGEYETGGSAGVNLSVPLFEGGRNVAKIDEERALLAARQERVKALRLRINNEIETAMLDIVTARERLISARTAIKAAEEGLRIENLKYEQGKGTISEVLDAQAELLSVQTDRDESATELLIALARLNFVTGGYDR